MKPKKPSHSNTPPSRPKAFSPSGSESPRNPPLPPRGHAASDAPVPRWPPRRAAKVLAASSVVSIGQARGSWRRPVGARRGGGRLSDSTIPWLVLTRRCHLDEFPSRPSQQVPKFHPICYKKKVSSNSSFSSSAGSRDCSQSLGSCSRCTVHGENG